MKAECTEEYPRCILPFSLSVCFPTKNSTKGGVVLMYNPIRLYTGTEEEYVMIQGYVRSVTESKKGDY